jgi:predicted GIY-YIG superfamily endonuclease
MGYVYILSGKSNGKTKYYIGSTKDLKKRLQQHFEGYTKTTKNWTEKRCILYFITDREVFVEQQLKKRRGAVYYLLGVEKYARKKSLENLMEVLKSMGISIKCYRYKEGDKNGD